MWAADALETSPTRVVGLAVARFVRELVTNDQRLNDLKIVLADVDEVQREA